METASSLLVRTSLGTLEIRHPHPGVHGQHKAATVSYDTKKDRKLGGRGEKYEWILEESGGGMRIEYDQNILYTCTKFSKNENNILKIQ